MKRRDFIKTAALAGIVGTGVQSCASTVNSASSSVSAEYPPGQNFDLHPFVRNHPEAVFIHVTSVESKRDTRAILDTGNRLAKELIVSRKNGRYPVSTKITIKPNWTCASPKDGKPVFEKLGVNTDPHFVEGWVQGMKKAGPQSYYIRESACPNQWEIMGWTAMTERNGIDFRDLTSKNYWELEKGRDINFVKVPRGVVFNEIGFMAPMNEYDTFLINIAKMKSHSMGITGCVKNLQGICGNKFVNFCNPHNQIRKTYDRRYHPFFQYNFEEHIEALYEKHVRDGIPRWDKPGIDGGIAKEMWVQRMLDSLSVTPTALNMVEGIYSQDGSGFGNGPHEKTGPAEVTSRDYMSNMVMFGIDPFRVDIINFWLAGHEPGNFGLFHIAHERGMSDVLDPHDIPVYLWENGRAKRTSLDNLTRTPLVTAYLRRDYHGQSEPEYHLCNEPFDYSAWKAGKPPRECTPSIQELGLDQEKNMIMELSIPERDNVYVDVVDKNGDKVWRLFAEDIEPGVHQVTWDNFDKHGMYTVYMKGMRWHTKKQIMTYV